VSGLWAGGFDRWAAWETAPCQWLLMTNTFAFDATDDVVADIAASEVTVIGYSRAALTGPALADHSASGVRTKCYGCAAPAFNGLDPGQAIRAAVLALDDGADATSGLVAWWPVNQPTDLYDITFDFPPWTFSGSPLPGGDVDTRLIHYHQVWVTS
jgi:hypothetical protein